jgi:ATP-dependent helicase/nuclease subunit B
LQVRGWLAAHQLALRDAIVLVPYAALIEPVRSAFAAQAGWQPRVETARTLAAALGPTDPVQPGQCSGDASLDRLQAEQWLAGITGDGSGIDARHAAATLAEAASALAQAASEQAPDRRAAWHLQVLQAIGSTGARGAGQPGAIEAALLRAATAWAAEAPVAATDRLFGLQPSAWVVLRLGGVDRLAEALLQHADAAALLLDLDPSPEEPFGPWAGRTTPRLLCATDVETESMAAATEVLEAVSRNAGRVALVALDRALARRVVSLLQRAGVEVDDETGWKLSTTAAAGRVLSRLRAAALHASGDDRLDWLKRWSPAQRQADALLALEHLWRQGRNARLAPEARKSAEDLWALAEPTLAAWRGVRDRQLADWLDLLRHQLADDGDEAVLSTELAGLQLLQALQAAASEPAWLAVLRQTRSDLAGFTAWVESLCESLTVQHVPRPDSQVVLTPLARAIGRPFGQVVVAGADARRLGRDGGGPALVPDALAQQLGLETITSRRDRVRLSLAQLLRAPLLTILWRQMDGDAPVGPAAEVDWMRMDWQQAGHPLPVLPAAPAQRELPSQPVQRPLPIAPLALPTGLSASAVEALRQCPYRFFSRAILRLGDIDEIDQPARKRDYGDWLHAALHRFHSTRQPAADDAAALWQAADAAMHELALAPEAMLAFRASLQQLVPAYLAWLQHHEAAGWRWQAGEDFLQADPADWAPQTLRGRIDRVDVGKQGVRLVLDYKTGNAQGLKQRLKDASEDTQLPFYVALLQAQGEGGDIQAAYLALDEADGPRLLPHDDVQASAALLIDAVGTELQRLRDGAPMPALGEGSICETCEARGLCRRDQWPALGAEATGGLA